MEEYGGGIAVVGNCAKAMSSCAEPCADFGSPFVATALEVFPAAHLEDNEDKAVDLVARSPILGDEALALTAKFDSTAARSKIATARAKAIATLVACPLTSYIATMVRLTL
ncbi:hypothetical protein ACH5RR_008990, partial [Cinchona calisaya]